MTTSTCPAWCVQTTPHGVHQSALIDMPRGVARWTVSLGQIDGHEPHVTLIYLGVQPSADAHWALSLADAKQYALFAARLGQAQVAAALTTMAEVPAATAPVPDRYEAADAGLAELAQVQA